LARLQEYWRGFRNISVAIHQVAAGADVCPKMNFAHVVGDVVDAMDPVVQKHQAFETASLIPSPCPWNELVQVTTRWAIYWIRYSIVLVSQLKIAQTLDVSHAFVGLHFVAKRRVHIHPKEKLPRLELDLHRKEQPDMIVKVNDRRARSSAFEFCVWCINKQTRWSFEISMDTRRTLVLPSLTRRQPPNSFRRFAHHWSSLTHLIGHRSLFRLRELLLGAFSTQ
jgi:hypothetical protein